MLIRYFTITWRKKKFKSFIHRKNRKYCEAHVTEYTDIFAVFFFTGLIFCLVRNIVGFAYTQENLLTDGEGSGGDADDQEVTDECAMLIHTDHMNKHAQIKSGQDKSTGIVVIETNDKLPR